MCFIVLVIIIIFYGLINATSFQTTKSKLKIPIYFSLFFLSLFLEQLPTYGLEILVGHLSWSMLDGLFTYYGSFGAKTR